VWDRVDGIYREQWPEAVGLALVPAAVAVAAAVVGVVVSARRLWVVGGGLFVVAVSCLSTVESVLVGYLSEPRRPNSFLVLGAVIMPAPGTAPEWDAFWPFAWQVLAVVAVVAGIACQRAWRQPD
jgi:hypothetical protein